MKREENDRVFVFLAGLNKNLDEVRGQILGQKPLPTIREVFSEVRKEEGRQLIMLSSPTPKASPKIENSALVSKVHNYGGKNDATRTEKPWCNHYKRPWHTHETCWKIHGKPQNWKKKSGSESCAFQVGKTDQGQEASLKTFPFIKEQTDQLLKLLQSSQTNQPSCSFA